MLNTVLVYVVIYLRNTGISGLYLIKRLFIWGVGQDEKHYRAIHETACMQSFHESYVVFI